MTEDDLLQRILKLTKDLNLQQQKNQYIASGIKSQVNELKYRTSNNQDSQDLHIDNDGLFQELIPANAFSATAATSTDNDSKDTNSDTLADIAFKHTQMVQEHTYFKSRNRELEQECAELQDLIHNYESSLELIAEKLRACVTITSDGQAQLRREYEALLDAEKGTTVALFMENAFLQSQLIKLSGTLRNSYEESTRTKSYNTQIQHLIAENEGLRTMLSISDQQSLQSPLTLSVTNNQAMIAPSIQTAKPSSGVIQEYFESDTNSNS